jgi:hypothetical protein
MQSSGLPHQRKQKAAAELGVTDIMQTLSLIEPGLYFYRQGEKKSGQERS